MSPRWCVIWVKTWLDMAGWGIGWTRKKLRWWHPHGLAAKGEEILQHWLFHFKIIGGQIKPTSRLHVWPIATGWATSATHLAQVNMLVRHVCKSFSKLLVRASLQWQAMCSAFQTTWGLGTSLKPWLPTPKAADFKTFGIVWGQIKPISSWRHDTWWINCRLWMVLDASKLSKTWNIPKRPKKWVEALDTHRHFMKEKTWKI